MIRRDLLKRITAVVIASTVLTGCGNNNDTLNIVAGTEPVTEASIENKTDAETKPSVEAKETVTATTSASTPTEKATVKPTEKATQPSTTAPTEKPTVKPTEEETKKGHWEEVVVEPARQELVTPAWTETKIETEQVLKREAWTETIEHPAEYIEVPNVRIIGYQKVLHTDWDELSQQWYDHWVDEPIYEDYIELVMVKEPWTETVQHPAEYETVTKEVLIEHPAVYRTIPAVTKMVWVEN